MDQYAVLSRTKTDKIGETLVVNCKPTGEAFSIKVIPKFLSATQMLMKNQLEVLDQCNKNKFCVKIMDSFEDDVNFYLVSKYYGKTLRDLATAPNRGMTDSHVRRYG